MPVNLTTVRSWSFFNDLEEVGVYDPGDVLAHRLTITNNGDETATGITFSDILKGQTFVEGTLNVSPIATNDSFTAVGNTELRVGGAASQSAGSPSLQVAGNLLSNDVGSATIGQGAIAADNVKGFTLDAVSNGVSAGGGSFNIFADGSFNYVNQAGDTGTDSFTYTIRDAGLDGVAGNADDLTSTATVTIQLQGEVWYVDSAAAAGGTGTSANPFNSIDALNAANKDGAGDTIYVEGNAQGAIVLENGQQLIGTGADLTVGGFKIAATTDNSPQTGNSTLTANGTNGYAVTVAQDNIIAGINIVGTGTNMGGITDNQAGSFGTLSLNPAASRAATGLYGSNVSATGAALNLSGGTIAGNGLTSVTSTGGTNNVSLIDIAGTLNFGGNLSGATGTALNISGGTLSAKLGTSITQASNAAMVAVTNHSAGTIEFNSGILNATNGSGLQFSNADGSYSFNSFNGATVLNGNSTGGDTGIDIVNGSDGTFFFGGNVNLTGASGTNFTVNGGGGNITFNGVIQDDNGQLLNISNRTGGTIDINGRLTDGFDGDGGGVSITNNSASSTVRFDGQLELSTGANAAFTASSAGTVIVTDSPFSIARLATTTGTALNVTNTTIGSEGLTFQSIASNGAVNGIVLNNTGTTGGLTVTGVGTTVGSGGIIQNTIGVGVSLTNTANVSLNGMTIANTGSHGVSGTGVTNVGNSGTTNNSFRFTNGLLDSPGDGDNESALWFDTLGATNITGRMTVSNTTIQNFEDVGIHVGNSSGSLVIDVTHVVFNDNSDTNGEEGIDVDANGTANTTLNVSGTPTGSQFDAGFTSTTRFINLEGGAINGTVQGNGVLDVNVSGTLTTGTGGPDNFPTPPAMTFSAEGSASTFKFDITGNRIADSSGDGLFIGHEGTIEGRITNNGIANAETGDGIRIDTDAQGTATATILIQGNTIDNIGDDGIQVLHRDGTKTLNLTITDNRITNTDSEGIRYFTDEDTATGGPLNRLSITNNTFGNNGREDTADSIVIISQDATTELFTEISGNTAVEGITLQNSSAFLGVEQTSNAALSAANGGAVVTEIGPITYNTPVTVPQPSNPIQAEAPPPLRQDAQPPQTGPSEGTPDQPASTSEGSQSTQQHGEAEPVQDAGSIVVDDRVISQAELDLIVAAAIERWAAAGATPEQLAAMRATRISIEDLAGLQLGQSDIGTIKLDADAAGWSWFIDATPGDDTEYGGTGTQLSATDKMGAAGTRIDLLTVVMHELGHQIGLSDENAEGQGSELMYGSIRAGERRLPGSDDAAAAGPAPVAGALAIGPIGLGSLQPGQSVTVEWRSTVDAPAEDSLVGNVAAQTTVDSDQTDPQTGTALSASLDSLTLGNMVFLDVNKNGVFDSATDSGIAGVTLTLYADTNNDGAYTDGVDQAVSFIDNNGNGTYEQGIDSPAAAGSPGAIALTATTDANGLYSFTDLAPGDYIVRIDPDDLSSTGVLAGRIPIMTATDPNENVDGDNNLQTVSGFSATRAIRLDYGQEGPGFDGTAGNDTNNTLDMGFFSPNQPPVITNLQGDISTFTEGSESSLQSLDAGGDVLVTDPDSQNFDGGTLTIAITGGLVAAEDVIVVKANGGVISISSSGEVRIRDLNNPQVEKVIGTTASAGQTGPMGTAEWSTVPGGNLVISLNANATADDVRLFVRELAYLNSNAEPTAGQRTVTITLVDGDGKDGGAGNDTASVTSFVNVVAVNDAPDGADKTLTMSEDGTRAFSASDFGFRDNAIDTDLGQSEGQSLQAVIITTLPAAGTLRLGGNAVTAGQTIAAADIPNLTYSPAANANGTAYSSFTFQVQDNGATGGSNRNTDQSPNTITFNVTAVNDAPVAVDDTLAGTEDASATFTAAQLTGNDSDVEGNTLTLASVTAVSGGTVVLNSNGTVTFTPAANFNGPAVFDYTVSDGNGGSDTGRATVNVAAVNDAPVIARVTGDNQSFFEGDPALRIDSQGNALVTDVDSANFNGGSLTASISASRDAAEDQLVIVGTPEVTVADGIVSVDGVAIGTVTGGGAGGGDLVVTFNSDAATPAAIQKLIGAIGYFNSDTAKPTTGGRAIDITLNDGDGTDNGGDATGTATPLVFVLGINDNPAGADRTVTLSEDNGYTFAAADFGFSDVDSNFAGVRITTLPDAAAGLLQLNGTAVTAGQIVAVADIPNLTYTPAANANGGNQASFTFQVRDDGAGPGQDPTANTITFNVTAVNDAPALSEPTAQSVVFEQGSTGTRLMQGVTLSDADMPANFSGGSITISISGTGGGISLPPTSDFKINDNGDGTFSLALQIGSSQVGIGLISGNGTSNVQITNLISPASLSRLNDLLDEFVYLNLDQNPDTSPRTVTLTFNDGGNTGGGGLIATQTQTLTVQAVNQAPAIANLNGDTVTFTEPANGGPGTPVLVDAGGNVVITDTDSANFGGGSLTVAVTATPAAQDQLFVNSGGIGPGEISTLLNEVRFGGVTFATMSGGSDTPLVFTFNDNATPAAVQALVRQISYSNRAGDSAVAGPRTITWTLVDGDGTAGGGSDTATVTSTVEVVATNDSPNLSTPPNQFISFTENGPRALLMQGVTINDPDFPANFEGGSLRLTADGPDGFIIPRLGSVIRVTSNGDGTSRLALQEGQSQVVIGTITGLGTLDVQITGLTAAATDARLEALLDEFAFAVPGENPTAGMRTVTLTLNDGGNRGDGGPRTSTQVQNLEVIAVDDPATAGSDAFTTDEATAVGGNLLTNDADVDGPALAVAEVNGSAAAVGQTITLPSGALLRVNADGSYDYNPNGAFNGLSAFGTGAENESGTDSFTYRLSGGTAAATVSVTVRGLQSTDDRLEGRPGNEVIFGTGSSDTFRMDEGGDDGAFGGGGDDSFYFGAAFNGRDYVDGGEGANDTLFLQGNYATAVPLGLVGVERVVLLSSQDARFGNASADGASRFSYALISADGTVAPNGLLTVDASGLLAGETLFFNGSGESDGSFNVTGGASNDQIIGGARDDVINGGGGLDVLAGGGGDDQLVGSDAEDHLDGGTGRDRLFGGGSRDYMFGGEEGDLLLGGSGGDIVFGGTGEDELRGEDGDDYLDGGSERDVIAGDAGRDDLRGGSGNDTLSGGADGDLLFGEEGEDELRGGDGDDYGVGGAGRDFIFGEGGQDTLLGGAEGDVLFGGDGGDFVFGEDGEDYLDGGAGRDILFGGGDRDTIFGGIDGDALIGGAAGDLLFGQDGDDQVEGEAGDDYLDAGIGNDRLIGGVGSDTLIGGAGADRFVFATAADSGAGGVDVLLDFDRAAGDRIDLTQIDADATTAGDDAFTFIGTAGFSNRAGELRYDVADGIARVTGDLDGNGTADFELNVVVGQGGSLTAADFDGVTAATGMLTQMFTSEPLAVAADANAGDSFRFEEGVTPAGGYTEVLGFGDGGGFYYTSMRPIDMDLLVPRTDFLS